VGSDGTYRRNNLVALKLVIEKSSKIFPLKESTAKPTAIVMAKWPAAGKVNTRLITDSFSAGQASAAGLAFLRCIISRLSIIFEGSVVIATSPDETVAEMEDFVYGLELAGVNSRLTVFPQGAGDLGLRMERIWQMVIDNQQGNTQQITPVCFFGMDSPDIPTPILCVLRDILTDGVHHDEPFDIAAGSTGDGGYWTLAGRDFHPEVLRDIAWGGDCVFQDTQDKAESAGLRFHSLEKWYDIDTPIDLIELMGRLSMLSSENTVDSTEKPLFLLREELLEIMAR